MKPGLFKRLIYPLILLLLLAGFFLLVPNEIHPAQSQSAWDEALPTTLYQGAPVPDWGQISFSNLPVLSDAGSLNIPNSIASELGYDPSRSWQENTPLDQVLMLGDVQDAFGLQNFNLDTIAQFSGLNLGNISLSNFPLVAQQTIGSLVATIPQLGQLTLDQVPMLKDLVNLNRSGVANPPPLTLDDLGSTSLSDLATDSQFSQLSLSNLNLSQYSFTDLPGLSQTPLKNLQNWQQTFVGEVPGLSQVPFAAFPDAPTAGYLGFIAIDDVTYGPMEHRRTPTQRSITGSDKVGFNYQCGQPRGCAYLELNSPGSLGSAGDPGLHGAQWIKGGTSPGAQMVPGGSGILGVINGGQEPTGRLPFGPVFKVVLINDNESTGTGTFGIYFRICHHGFIDLGCTPYFIGPIPWFTVHEKGIVFVGETQGTPPSDIPDVPPLPTGVQQQIDALIAANEPDSLSTVNLNADCLSKVISKVPLSDRTYADATVPTILTETQRAGITDPAQIAYILATAQTEADFHSQDEGSDAFKLSGAAGNYYGRGLAQVTWRSNYQYWSDRLGVDLVSHPELANQPDIAAKILVDGMRDGTFSGKRLGQYINGQNDNFVGARNIVNDTDKSRQIAQEAESYLSALNSCTTIASTVPTDITSANHPGQLIAQSDGTATEQKIVNAINAHYNESSASGPQGGDLACAYEVNRVLQDALGHKVGNNSNYVPSVEAALKGADGIRVSPEQSHAGDVVVFEGSGGEHIGFCTNNGCSQVLSNSSSQARFRWVGSRASYDSYYGSQSAEHIYRISS